MNVHALYCMYGLFCVDIYCFIGLYSFAFLSGLFYSYLNLSHRPTTANGHLISGLDWVPVANVYITITFRFCTRYPNGQLATSYS